MIKIVLISPILQHYRLTFYEKLSNSNVNYDLTVFHRVKKKEDGRPGFIGETNFKNNGFRQFKFKIKPFYLSYSKGMYTELKRVNPDVLIIQQIPGDFSFRRCISWAKSHNKKIIIWACGLEPGRAKGFLLKFKNILVKSFFRKADNVLTYSTNGSKYVENLGISKDIIEICYNGIETDELIRNHEFTIKKSLHVIDRYDLKDYLTFIYVGALHSRKKVDFLINAFSILRKTNNNIKLIIIGDGRERQSIEALLEQINDDQIYYLGRIVEGVDAYFAASDCYVLPGVGGLGLNQALYWKKSCIVSEADGTEEDLIIDQVTGYRFIKNNQQSLIDTMQKRINSNQQTLKKMAENGYDIVMKRSNVNNMVEVFSRTIEKLI